MYILVNYVPDRQQSCPSLQKSVERQYATAVDTSEIMTGGKPERMKMWPLRWRGGGHRAQLPAANLLLWQK